MSDTLLMNTCLHGLNTQLITLIRLLRMFKQHTLTRNHILRACLRFIVFQASCRYLKSSLIIDWISGIRLVVAPGMTGVTGELYTGLLEFEDSLFTVHVLRPEELFVDVGANAGTYSLLAAKLAKGNVIALEPCKAAVQSLKLNLALNGVEDRVEIIEKGASDKVGALRFTMDIDALNRVTTHDGPNTVECGVAPLDDILAEKAPVLIKIDVEGHEKWVIEGARKAFASPQLLAVQIETGEAAVENNVLGMMEAQGFTACAYAPERRELKITGALSPHNTLFVKNFATTQARLHAAPPVNVYGKFY
jgi:FkbM family methyltransferase